MRLPAQFYAFLCLSTGKILFKRRPSSKSTTTPRGVQSDEMLMLLYAIFLHTTESSWSSSMSDYRCGDVHHVFVKHTYFNILGIFSVTTSAFVEKDQRWKVLFDNALIRFVEEFDDILNDATKRRNATLATFSGFKKSIALIAREHCTELLAELGFGAQRYCGGEDYYSAAFKLKRVDGEERYVKKIAASRGILAEKDVTRVTASWLEETAMFDASGDDSLRLPCIYEKSTMSVESGDGVQSERTMIMGCIPFRSGSKKSDGGGAFNRVAPEMRRDGSRDMNQRLHFFSVRVGQIMIVTATNVIEEGDVMNPASTMGERDIAAELLIFQLAHQISPCIS